VRTDELKVRGEASAQLQFDLSQYVLSLVGNSGQKQRFGLLTQGMQSELLSRHSTW